MCFDAVFTEAQCCRASGEPSEEDESEPPAPECDCEVAAEVFIDAVVGAVAEASTFINAALGRPRQGRRAFEGVANTAAGMPELGQVSLLCSRFEALGGGLTENRPCLAARLGGHAVCAHAQGLRGDAERAAQHAELAAVAATALGRRMAPRCTKEMRRLVAPTFPFSEAEAINNALQLRAVARAAASGHRVAIRGWQREAKPQLGVRSELDEILEKYRTPALHSWHKQFGCQGGDTGELGNFFSHVYNRLFDHEGHPSTSPPGPSRHRPARVLEVGVCDGTGVALWSEYFRHSESRIVALDIDLTLFRGNLLPLLMKGFNRSRLAAAVEVNVSALGLAAEARVTVGSTTVVMNGLAALRAQGPFDFIRDDASHVESDTIATFKTLFPRVLRPGGVYAVEDVWTSPSHGQYHGRHDVNTSLDASGDYSYFFRLARDAVNFGWRFDAARYSRALGTALIQSLEVDKLEAWVEAVEFSRSHIIIRKRPDLASGRRY